MERISYREFQRGFCKYKMGEYLVYGRGGEVVGHWIPGGKVSDKLEEGDVEEEYEELGPEVAADLSDKQEEMSDKEEMEKEEKRRTFEALKERFGGDKPRGVSDNLSDIKLSARSLSVMDEEEGKRCIRCGGMSDGVAQTEDSTGRIDDHPVCGGCAKRYKLKLR